jgi:UDP-N-acetylglucosamine--N-acetylmuramyl-(pentapeptide) pyrophosphoryl-undecaprenol N-acetylglucosamine transferase
MKSKRPWFVLAGGGTGGHLYPGLAVAEAMRKINESFDITVFGTPRPIDQKLTKPRGFELVKQPVRAWTSRPWQWPGFLFAWRKSGRAARKRFVERRPTAVLGLGGYAAGPAVIAAAKLGIPTALFNPDAVPGRANRYLAPRVDRVFVQWEATMEHFPRVRGIQCTGCPIRPQFVTTTREQGIERLKLSPKKKTLLITGASQGAHSINLAVMKLVDLLQTFTDWQIVHLTGAADLEMCKTIYKSNGVPAQVIPFTEEMPACMAAADLVISRAGASTLAEITAVGVASILYPYPFDRKQHQRENAKVLADTAAAIMLDDRNDAKKNADRLREDLPFLLKSDLRRKEMAQAARALGRTDADRQMAESLIEMARKSEG